MSESSGRFPTVKNMSVDELIEAYAAVLPGIDAALANACVSGEQEAPEPPDGLTDIMRMGMNGDPFPPEDLTELTPVDLGKAFSYLSGFTNYVQSECTRTKTHLDLREKKAEIIRSALRMHYSARQGSEKIAAALLNDYVVTDPRYVSCDVDCQKLRGYSKALESRYEQLKRSLNNVSREQTRRQDEFQREMHDSHGGRTPTTTPRF